MEDADLIRLVDQLEERAALYVTRDQVEAVAGDVTAAIAASILLVDERTLVDGGRVTLCRLNRRHPMVAKLTSW